MVRSNNHHFQHAGVKNCDHADAGIACENRRPTNPSFKFTLAVTEFEVAAPQALATDEILRFRIDGRVANAIAGNSHVDVEKKKKADGKRVSMNDCFFQFE
jgi:hypothetical protein